MFFRETTIWLERYCRVLKVISIIFGVFHSDWSTILHLIFTHSQSVLFGFSFIYQFSNLFCRETNALSLPLRALDSYMSLYQYEWNVLLYHTICHFSKSRHIYHCMSYTIISSHVTSSNVDSWHQYHLVISLFVFQCIPGIQCRSGKCWFDRWDQKVKRTDELEMEQIWQICMMIEHTVLYMDRYTYIYIYICILFICIL